MEQQHYCFLYTGAKEEEIAFEVWDGIAEPKNAGDDPTCEGWYLFDNGDMSTLKPINSTILTHTDWLNRIRPLQVGDVVEHTTEGKGVIKRIEDDEGSVLGLVEFSHVGAYFLRVLPSTLRLISLAEKPTEWQPKWGEEVEAYCCGETFNAFYGCKNPFLSTYHTLFDKDGRMFSTTYIRPLPPKTKTLREEVWDWLKQEGCSLSCDSRIKLSHIIDRHEKGDPNA